VREVLPMSCADLKATDIPFATCTYSCGKQMRGGHLGGTPRVAWLGSSASSLGQPVIHRRDVACPSRGGGHGWGGCGRGGVGILFRPAGGRQLQYVVLRQHELLRRLGLEQWLGRRGGGLGHGDQLPLHGPRYDCDAAGGFGLRERRHGERITMSGKNYHRIQDPFSTGLNPRLLGIQSKLTTKSKSCCVVST